MLANTPKLQLPQWESTDDFEYTQVNDALLRVDTKAAPSAYATANRPVGTERYDGLIILDTDLDKYLKWNATAAAWRSIDFDGDDSPSVALAPAAGITISGTPNFTHKNGIAQIYFTFSYNAALADGDIGNFNICTVPDPWKPRQPTVLVQGAAGPVMGFYMNTAGVITLNSTGAAISANYGLSCGGMYILT